MSEVTLRCAHCGKPFNKRLAEVNRSKGKHFCSKSCSADRLRQESKDNFWNLCDRSGDCWEWQGKLNDCGYGLKRYMGKLMNAHRAAYLHAVGEIPDGMCVCHSCDNTKCMNPDHLWLGTHQDNMDDMWEKGRGYTKDREPLPQPPTAEEEK